MSKVTVSSVYSASPDSVWSIIGKPGTISDWHPAISKSSSQGAQRTCTLADGAEVLETILEHDDATRAYRYKIDSSPLPMKDYVSTIRVAPRESGCEVVWESEFTPDGAPAEDVEGAIRGLYQAGLEHLRGLLG